MYKMTFIIVLISISTPVLAQDENANYTSWMKFVHSAEELSAAQHRGGKAIEGRMCEPNKDECRDVLFYRDANGQDVMVREIFRKSDHSMLRREVCHVDGDAFAKECIDWNTKKQIKRVKDANGKWRVISQQ